MSACKRLLLLSSSRVHGYEFLEYAADIIRQFLNKSNVKNVLFIPYALTNHDEYTQTVKTAFKKLKLEYNVTGIHEAKGKNPADQVEEADAIFIGGGNTFVLLKTLYEKNLMEAIRKRVLMDNVPYIGSSAGTNVATVSINTTNDMPIVYPPSFNALNLVPFNINPHYLDADPDSKHKGETRAERISQYHELPHSCPVLGLREGSILHVEGKKAYLLGDQNAILFQPRLPVKEILAGSDLSELL